MLGGLLLLPNEVTHEVAQKLRCIAVTAFGGVGELGLQRLIDPESKGCFVHGLIPRVLSDWYNVTLRPSRLRRQRKQRRLTLEMLSAKVGPQWPIRSQHFRAHGGSDGDDGVDRAGCHGPTQP
jgi:hypothetical protein